jgi:hypothetical protein
MRQPSSPVSILDQVFVVQVDDAGLCPLNPSAQLSECLAKSPGTGDAQPIIAYERCPHTLRMDTLYQRARTRQQNGNRFNAAGIRTSQNIQQIRLGATNAG